MKKDHREYYHNLKKSILKKDDDMTLKEYISMLRNTRWKIKDLKSELVLHEKIAILIQEKIKRLRKKKADKITERSSEQ